MVKGSVYTPTDTVYGVFNTCDPDTGAPITLAGTPSLKLERNRAGTWSSITGAGITLAVDATDTGRHTYVVDLDNANIVAAAGDVYRLSIAAGTVDANSAVGLEVAHFFVEADGLTTQQKADVNTEADTAITDGFGIVTGSVNDAAATVNGFTVTDDAGSDIRLGSLRLTSGALSGESRLVTWTGTTIAVVKPTSVPAGLTTIGPFSAAPANEVTFTFRPL